MGGERGGCVKEEKGCGKHARENWRGENEGGFSGGRISTWGKGGLPTRRERQRDMLDLTWVGKGLARGREPQVSLAWVVNPPTHNNTPTRRPR